MTPTLPQYSVGKVEWSSSLLSRNPIRVDQVSMSLQEPRKSSQLGAGGVVEVLTRQTSRQRRPLGLVHLAVGLLGLGVLDVARHRRQVNVECLVEQALLLGAKASLFAANLCRFRTAFSFKDR